MTNKPSTGPSPEWPLSPVHELAFLVLAGLMAVFVFLLGRANAQLGLLPQENLIIFAMAGMTLAAVVCFWRRRWHDTLTASGMAATLLLILFGV